MTNIQKIAELVKSLPREEFDQFLAWLADYELEQPHPWDEELERDSQPGGPLSPVLQRVRRDIALEKIRPLDEFLHDA